MIKFLTSTVIATLPFSYIKVFGNFSYIDLFLAAIFLFLLFDKIIQNYNLREYLLDNCFIIPIAIYSMGFFLSWPYSLNYYDSFLSYLQVIFIFIVIYPIFTWLIDNNSFIDYALYGLSITTVFITFFLIMYFLIGFDIFNDFLYIQKGWGSRFSYGGYEPNITARIMAQCIPILLILAVDSKNLLVKVLNYIFIVLLTLGIILTASRTGLLVLLLGIVAYIFFSFRIDVNKNLKLLLPIFSFILIFIYMANQYPDTFTKPLDRYYTIFSPNENVMTWDFKN